MQIVKKMTGFITIILSLIMAFILVNILIGGLRFGSFSGYFNILDTKSWDTVSGRITWNPISRVKIFYEDTKNPQVQVDPESEKLLNKLDELLPRDIDSTQFVEDESNNDLLDPTFQTGLEEVIDTGNDGDNPYDPDFEDEFNSFFAGK